MREVHNGVNAPRRVRLMRSLAVRSHEINISQRMPTATQVLVDMFNRHNTNHRLN